LVNNKQSYDFDKDNNRFGGKSFYETGEDDCALYSDCEVTMNALNLQHKAVCLKTAGHPITGLRGKMQTNGKTSNSKQVILIEMSRCPKVGHGFATTRSPNVELTVCIGSTSESRNNCSLLISAVRIVLFHFESNRIVIVGLKSHQ